VEATLEHRAVDPEECRRLARTLRLDAVGVLRRDPGGRSLTWWSAPGAPALPLEVDAIVEGRTAGWVVAPAGDAVVMGRLTDRSSARSVTALRSLLAGVPSILDEEFPPEEEEEDPLDRERSRWAYAIHDGLTQTVTAAILDLEWRARQVECDPSAAVDVLTQAGGELRRALEEIRAILAVVTPDDDERDETAALDEMVRRVSQRWHVPAEWSVDGDLAAVPAPVLDAATSVIRESVANAAKHSATRRIAVHVAAKPTEMEVSVEDTGSGFRPQDAGAGGGHLGLAMMRRRVEELNGTLDIQSEPGRGTRVVARLPVAEGETP
jgi:signal transduction histidine kinase